MNLLFLDTETTGLSANDRIIQVGYCLCRVENKAYEIKSEFFAAPVPISFEAMAVHHITHKMLEGKPSFADSELKAMLQVLSQNAILIAHNAKFDADMLAKEDVHFKVWIDTERLAMHLIDSPRYNLQYLRYSLALDEESRAHDAVGDVTVLAKLFEYLFKKLSTEFNSNQAIIDQMITLSASPVLLRRFSFGKYKDKTIAEVAEFDRGYLSWLYNSEMGKIPSERNENLLFTLQQYLQNYSPENTQCA
jgi:exodeoxyribonuclease X